MALTTTQVTGRLPLPDDTVWTGSYVEFQLRAVDTDGSDIVMTKPVVAEMDTDGQIDVGLWPNDQGERDTSYVVTAHLMSPLTLRTSPVSLGYIFVPTSPGAIALADLITLSAPVPAVPDALAQALAAAAAAQASLEALGDEAAAAAASADAAAGSATEAAGLAGAAAASAQEAADTASSVSITIATQAEAEAGTNNGHLMTPLRSAQAFSKQYTDRLAADANLSALSDLTLAADKGLYATGADTLALYDQTAFGRTLQGAADAAAGRAALEAAPLESPALTGTPTAPTQAVGDNSARLATTAFVKAGIPAALAAMTYGAVGSLVFAAALTTGDQITEGSTIAGSALKPAGVFSNNTGADAVNTEGSAVFGGSYLSGTWRALGRARTTAGVSTTRTWATLFVRIA